MRLAVDLFSLIWPVPGRFMTTDCQFNDCQFNDSTKERDADSPSEWHTHRAEGVYIYHQCLLCGGGGGVDTAENSCLK